MHEVHHAAIPQQAIREIPERPGQDQAVCRAFQPPLPQAPDLDDEIDRYARSDNGDDAAEPFEQAERRAGVEGQRPRQKRQNVHRIAFGEGAKRYPLGALIQGENARRKPVPPLHKAIPGAGGCSAKYARVFATSRSISTFMSCSEGNHRSSRIFHMSVTVKRRP